ncbi:L-serine ammonia-lyase [Membranihabitans maritimus]|uniref:L-serine ammonia-lyase n=1 Tax=Membranihabitans maritimus TaxID=2904244 RepID=UPI001F010122|nr:L-serine ammonia-lyase [Membranihabitans maritimus]
MTYINVFEMFKIGIGPSSSHTLGPWKAMLMCLDSIQDHHKLEEVSDIMIELYGSLAKTGKGHGTEKALLLGLMGENPTTIPPESIDKKLKALESGTLLLGNKTPIPYHKESTIIFNKEKALDFHSNGMKVYVNYIDDTTSCFTYYSIGGGFVVEDGTDPENDGKGAPPFPIQSTTEMIRHCKNESLSIWQIAKTNELQIHSEEELTDGLDQIWDVMRNCMFRGCHTDGILPGGLNVKRRANSLYLKRKLTGNYSNSSEWMQVIQSHRVSNFQEIIHWVSAWAIAVNEENADFGRVVTAPTNGAAGVIPAVLAFAIGFTSFSGREEIHRFLLTASVIGSLFKQNATISAAMGGCQAEIGVSSAMAAAGLAELIGGSPDQVCMAAEIAMEHHLGLTCDPVGGLVQVPCIERNSMGAVKAITAAYLAVESDPAFARVSLDDIIETMWDTARDMNTKYKETSEGGLAIKIPVNFPEC